MSSPQLGRARRVPMSPQDAAAYDAATGGQLPLPPNPKPSNLNPKP
jgi:hypothetical protein